MKGINFNPAEKKYRKDLAEKLLNTRKGSFISRTKDFILGASETKARSEIRNKNAHEILEQEQDTEEYRITSKSAIKTNGGKIEKAPIYNEQGQVVDIETARVGAEIELGAHTIWLGPYKKAIDLAQFKAEIAMEKAWKIEIVELPFAIKRRFLDIRKKMENEHFYLREIFESDIGGGIMRYRICYRKDTSSMRGIPGVTPIGSSSGDVFRNIFVFDVKNKTIINSNLEQLITSY